ncbi:hypothetical protein NP493_977g01000 [Ridgeia piscesae]|uniref:Cytochrome b-c1 complex subunit 10 n=1 Tax=Ridgeia piscesae TaxID=27915 RepID=A0AAD9KJ00_RIDPI|nr:hypothetical protein NP493_977g01000 [Ridgeia piscesae]
MPVPLKVFKFVGPRYLTGAQLWMPSAAVFSITGVCGCLFYTDWKTVMQYVPWYGQKYNHEVPK